MTIAEIAAQMGVTPETLVQEVIARESSYATAKGYRCLVYTLPAD